MIIHGDIVKFDGSILTVRIPLHVSSDVTRQLLQKEIKAAEIRIDDGREITSSQRKKIYAMIKAISEFSGEFQEKEKEDRKAEFITKQGIEWFSLSDTDVSTAREFINYLVDFCIYNGIPFERPLIEYTEDIGKYIYTSLECRKCAVCGSEWADIHHCTGSRVGMGNNRNKIIHVGLNCIPLCRIHHNECHAGEIAFMKKYHLCGIELDRYLCRILGLNVEAS